MSYTWTNGEVITADKLNNTGGSGFLLVTDTNGTLDKTWKEISDSINANVPVYVRFSATQQGMLIDGIFNAGVASGMDGDTMTYMVVLIDGMNSRYTTYTETGYPTSASGS